MLQLCNVSARRAVFAVALATARPPEDCRRRSALRPGGTPQEISRGQVRVSGRSPRLPPRTGHAPAGHRRSFWHRAHHGIAATTPCLGQSGPPVSGLHPGPFLRCPAGARSHSARFPGAASAGADLPPANILWRPSGTGTGPQCTDQGNPLAQEWRSKLVRWRLRHSVLQLCKILARRDELPVPRSHFTPSHSLAPNSPAQFGRTHEPLRPARHAGRRPRECVAFPSAPSLSAFLPISAVFHSAPPRSERFLKTPQRSEGTQRGKGHKRVPHTHCGGGQSFASILAAPRARLRLPSSVFIASLWSIPVPPCHLA